MKIEDGTGQSFSAEVDKTKKLNTRAVTQTEQLEASKDGKSYQVGSGVINLTSAGESAVIYLKNNEEKALLLTGVNITSTAMTGSSANVFLAKIYTGSTGLSSSTAQTALNNNFGNSNVLDADIEAGAEAATVTNGTAAGAFYIPSETFFNTDIAWVLPKGSTIAVSVTPGASNTSMNVTVTIEAHLEA